MRNFPNWLQAYCEYSQNTEAPERMRMWCGISAIAGALRRKVWIDMAYFQWYANQYVILVAPPGIVSKSTTANVAMRLLRQVPGIRFGPDVVTWQSLVTDFAAAREDFMLDGAYYPMSAMTIESSEFGNLLNPNDRDMVDMLVNMWDGKTGVFEKHTKMSGNDSVVNPWINIIACTTPAWIAGNFPDYMIGGGFTSRCVFVYAEEKEKYVAYPSLHVPPHLKELEVKLVQDLEHISLNLCGGYKLTPEAYAWGESWYRSHYTTARPQMDDERFGGYIARKQTHIHKLAMILAAASNDVLEITPAHLSSAAAIVSSLEKDMQKVFEKIGRSDLSNNADRLLFLIQKSPNGITVEEAYKGVRTLFPDAQEFQRILEGLTRSGVVKFSLDAKGMPLLKAGS